MKDLNHEELFQMQPEQIVETFSVGEISCLSNEDAEDLKYAIQQAMQVSSSGKVAKKLSRLYEASKRQLKKATRQMRSGRQHRHEYAEI